MKFNKLDIAGAWLIDPEPISDDRGVFRRHFCTEEFAAHGIDTRVMQGNVSENPHLHTLRGFHFQLPPHAESKTISCFTGALYDIIVDLRPDSSSFLQWVAVTLDAKDRTSLVIPAGCANAYLTMEKNTVVHYYMSESYTPASYRGFRYNDPAFKFIWPTEPRLISEKDRVLPFYHDGLLESANAS
jgi:dTDP-4-dehydrorhamnose 3,5-epimerase